jgi:F-type H+-transporting ATPase subunit epsilon
MSEKTIKFEIVTPERVVWRREVSQLTVPTTTGEITVLPNHVPLVSILQPGVISFKDITSQEVEIVAVSNGFIEVMKDKVVILADTAERAEELDESRIKEAQIRAEERRHQAQTADSVQFADISAQIEKQLAREKALNRWRKLKKAS